MWVYCGDKEQCKGSYKECWLKHLVRPHACLEPPTDSLTGLRPLRIGFMDAKEP